ncbi:hypothetical protein AB0L53_46910 [Nonomuraea sp. NPDC052129]|uniref:hypothetical protein n=1 Tax=Nonomuraea sp. NPDC052129 TaxID=3154651 RepID=UPI00343155AF
MTGRRLAHSIAVVGCAAYALLICDLALSDADTFLTVTMAILGLVSVTAAILPGRPKAQRDLAYQRGIISEARRIRQQR